MDTKKQKKKKVDKKEPLIPNWQEKYLRALADYHNLEKRTQNQINQSVLKANELLLIKIIEVLDDICQAEIFIKDEGLKLIKNKVDKILTDENVVEIDIVGKQFDPYLAECIEIVPGDNDNIVVSVEKRGYKLNNHLLRPAKVKVSKKVS